MFSIGKGLIMTLAIIGLSTQAHAVDMVKKAELEINGQVYVFPVGVKEREMDVFWLKKAVGGDKDALEMFLGGMDERLFYVGDDTPVWLRVKNDGTMEVI